MGIYDRDYEREYDDGYGRSGGFGQGGIQIRFPQTTVGQILLINFVVFAIQVMTSSPGSDPMGSFFALTSDWYQQPWQVYQLLTYGFLHDPSNLMHIAGNMFGFWIFGRDLEQRFGSREFLYFYLAAILAGGVTYTLGELTTAAPSSVLGASGGTVAVTILYAVLYPHRQVLLMFILPVPMWALGIFIVGSDVMGALSRSGNTAFMAHLGGAAFAGFYYFQQLRLTNYLPSGGSGFKLPSFKRRPKLRVHREEDEPSDTGNPKGIDKQVDDILAKIADKGQDSLTRKEKRILEQASRQYKKRDR